MAKGPRNPLMRIFGMRRKLAYLPKDTFVLNANLSDLEEFRVEARLTKKVPLDSDEDAASWYGGWPRMPKTLTWPSSGANPMVFLAQIACRDLPADLWGGMGPRAGWLLFFVLPDYQGTDEPWQLRCKVLHIDKIGPERTHVFPDTVQTVFLENRETAPNNLLPFPRWPMVIRRHHVSSGQPDDPFPGRDVPSEGEIRPDPNTVSWPGGEAGQPLTNGGLREMLLGIRNALEKQIERAQWVINRTQENKDRLAQLSPAEFSALPKAERLSLSTNIDIVGALLKVQETNQRAVEVIDSLMGDLPDNADQLPSKLWQSVVATLGATTGIAVEERVVLPGEDEVRRQTFRFRRFPCRPPIGDLTASEAIAACFRALNRANKEGREAQNLIRGVLKRLGAMPEIALNPLQRQQLADAKSQQGELDRTVQAAVDAQEVLAKWRNLCAAAASETIDPTMVDEITEAFGPVRSVRARYKTLVPRRLAVIEYSTSEHTLLDNAFHRVPGALGSWTENYERKRAQDAVRIYTHRPDALPPAVRTHFEAIWKSHAAHQSDIMGGEDACSSEKDYFFNPALYIRPDHRADWMKKNAEFLLRKELPGRPGDDGYAHLLKLRSDRHLGWMWGDLNSVSFLIPRRSLAEWDFEGVVAIYGSD